ncbi:hypothetical protein CW368_07605 [Actinomycetales bacterium SN12]|nr:hypothetical protein CW368_07605 [Actinomycetales bacterium SN12]
MSDSTPAHEPTDDELLENGLDDGTGDPNDDRAYLQDTPPAQVDDEAVRENAAEEETAGDGDRFD